MDKKIYFVVVVVVVVAVVAETVAGGDTRMHADCENTVVHLSRLIRQETRSLTQQDDTS